MDLAEAVRVVVLEKYSDFSGRASRAEYWYFTLATILVYVGFGILWSSSSVFGVLILLVALGLIVPTLAVGVRRLHDTNRSGWWMLIGLVPLGSIVLFVFYCLAGDQGENQYGPRPPA